ncbi:DUF3291 domain-containing protein [Maribacter sp. 2307ULW6-5]|uniref:DUF3291 domain-containing protein n=1 Tax=Maribacter sp. 2307ULW6-5 TaxID=3386275 RepID=UPI0039BC28CC
MEKYHLAQANIARFKAPLTDPLMKEFVDFLEPVNAFAEASPGFVWRLTDDQGRSANYLETPFKDGMMAVNISVWEDMEAFKAFVYDSVHSYFLRNKKKWFHAKGTSLFVMWWLPAGKLPNLQMAKERLEHYEREGNSAWAFTVRQPYGPNGAPLKN